MQYAVCRVADKCGSVVLALAEHFGNGRKYFAILSPMQLIRDYALFERLFLGPELKQLPFPTLGVQIQDLKDSQKESFSKNVEYGEGFRTT